jgi:hypothetical protein
MQDFCELRHLAVAKFQEIKKLLCTMLTLWTKLGTIQYVRLMIIGKNNYAVANAQKYSASFDCYHRGDDMCCWSIAIQFCN